MRLLLFLLLLAPLGAQTYSDYESHLIRYEGLRLRPYKLHHVWHIGVAHAMRSGEWTTSIARERAIELFRADLDTAIRAAQRLTFFDRHPPSVRVVIVGLIYNVGATGFARFRDFRAALEVGDYEGAARELRESKWARQVGNRADDYAYILRTTKPPRFVIPAE